MKVALTYHLSVKHDVAITETTTTFPGTNFDDILTVNTPSSFNLDFQTGIAENTLLFGNIRQVKWIQTALIPPIFAAGNSGESLKKFSRDPTSYSIGLGRKLSDQWSGAVTYGTEVAEGTTGGPLVPTDGYSKMGVGLTYTGEQATVTLGMQKVNMGDTTTGASGPTATMSGNTATATAVKVGYKF